MRVLGIDPGSNFMGLGCVESRGKELVCVGHSVIHVKADSFADRLGVIFLAVQEAIALWQPTQVAAEEVFFAKNAQSALKLGQARGAAIAAAAVQGLVIAEYPATQIKQAVSGSGRADKDQVHRMIAILLGSSLKALPALERHDASDALAIAICHLQNVRLSTKLSQSPNRNKGLGAGV